MEIIRVDVCGQSWPKKSQRREATSSSYMQFLSLQWITTVLSCLLISGRIVDESEPRKVSLAVFSSPNAVFIGSESHIKLVWCSCYGDMCWQSLKWMRLSSAMHAFPVVRVGKYIGSDSKAIACATLIFQPILERSPWCLFTTLIKIILSIRYLEPARFYHPVVPRLFSILSKSFQTNIADTSSVP